MKPYRIFLNKILKKLFSRLLIDNKIEFLNEILCYTTDQKFKQLVLFKKMSIFTNFAYHKSRARVIKNKIFN